jgi:hypothetical protein
MDEITSAPREKDWKVPYQGEWKHRNGGIGVCGVAGMAGLFPRIFAGSPRYFCRECGKFHDSDETAEWLLIGHNSRDLTDGQFRQLPFRIADD